MKSNKQRRAEIKELRLQRAERAEALLRDERLSRVPRRVAGTEPADEATLLRHNPSLCVSPPAYYIDRPFCCRDCGAEEVWTAKQQKWWFETIGANLDSRAARCLDCRRLRRAAAERVRLAPGANLLGEEVAWLRSVGSARPDAATEQRVEAALASKWDGVRKVAIEVLGRWRRPQDVGRLHEWASDARQPWYNGTRTAAVQALAPLLRHPADDALVLEAFASAHHACRPWGDFVQSMDARTLDAFFERELTAPSGARVDEHRLENLCVMLMHARRLPSDAVWQRLCELPSARIANLLRHAARMASEPGA